MFEPKTKKTTAKYAEITQTQLVLTEVFFAFSDEQFEEGKAKMPQGEQICSGGMGMYGTQKGFENFRTASQAKIDKIKAECTPQEIYNYEFSNHECGYICDDEEAIEIVREYFPNAKVRRKYAYTA